MARISSFLGLVLLRAGLAVGHLRGLSDAIPCGALFCAADAVCCSEAPAALCGAPNSTCCYNPSKTIANLCAPGFSCNAATGNCYVESLPPPGNESSSFRCGALTCATGSVCCDEAPAALCGAPNSTCCYNPSTTIANLCAPGFSCNAATGNCYVESLPARGNESSSFRCGALTCATGSACCDEAPAALCGAPNSTCCYNPNKTIANLCAPGFSCNAATGNCYVESLPPPGNESSSFRCGTLTCATGSVCCDEAPAALCGAPDSTCCYNPSKTIANLCALGFSCNAATGNCYVESLPPPGNESSSFRCGALTCARGSVCCDEAPVALCGAPDSTCCYNPSKTIANLCANGTFCHATSGNCFV